MSIHVAGHDPGCASCFGRDCDCGCCEGLGASTPRWPENRHGLPEIAYRSGVYSTFKTSLLARLSSSEYPELQDLATRDDDDFAIALLDSWSMMADVLTFYQERLANESYLRTATERLSVVELARLIGYRPKPGAAAAVDLAFTLDAAPGAPEKAVEKTRLGVGVRVQSTPGQDEQAQVFETVEEIEARPAWNELRARRTERQRLDSDTTELYLAGIETGLHPGDGLLFETEEGSRRVFGVIGDVEVQPAEDPTESRTRVELASILDSLPLRGSVADDLQKSSSPPPPAAGYTETTIEAVDLEAEAEVGGFRVEELFDVLEETRRPEPRVMVFRSHAAIFGHQAAPWKTLPISLREQEKIYKIVDGVVELDKVVNGEFAGDEDKWNDKTLDVIHGSRVILDAVYPAITAGSEVVLRDGKTWAIYGISGVAEVSHSQFNLTAKVSCLQTLGSDQATQFPKFDIQGTTVYAESEILDLARVVADETFAPDDQDWLELEGWIPGLMPGQKIAVRGEVAGQGIEVREVLELAAVEHDFDLENGGTRVKPKAPPAHDYVRDTVRINANVAAATHGESVQEVLGSGDARVPHAAFPLAQSPLTHVVADTVSGVESTLEVRVDGVLWKEEPHFLDATDEDRVYATEKTADDGKTVVRFGSGKKGARPSTGNNNVRARYRKGLGLAGNVGAGRLDVLMTRPLGVTGVSNPLPATGGADPEPLAEARRNAPVGMRTLGRVVSLLDYEDFARAFVGIAKALATWTWSGRERLVFLTVAGPGGAAVNPGGTTHAALRDALAAYGDPHVPVRVASYRPARFHVGVRVGIHPQYLEEKVLSAVEAALRDAYGFDARELGQAVAASEVIARVQGVEGVESVDLDLLYRAGATPSRSVRIFADLPRRGERAVPDAAELLTLHPGPLARLEVLP